MQVFGYEVDENYGFVLNCGKLSTWVISPIFPGRLYVGFLQKSSDVFFTNPFDYSSFDFLDGLHVKECIRVYVLNSFFHSMYFV